MRSDRLKRLARMGGTHDNFPACAFELKDGVVVLRREYLVFRVAHIGAAKLAPLQYSESVAVQSSVDAGGLLIIRLTHHEAYLPVGIGALSYEFKIRGNYKITPDFIVQVIELIPLKPDVVTRSLQGIDLRSGIVCSPACVFGIAYILVVVEYPDLLLGERST